MKKIFLLLFTILILVSCKSKPGPAAEAEIEIIEPEFEIVSIVILQADIVVTEFETVLRVKNPNNFAVTLTSLTYELFGNGAFWARGSANDILLVPPLGTSELKFTFDMNFINMSRRLLDDVIAMRQVNYRFRGDAQIQPDIPRIPPFTMKYDCSGLSEVRRN